MFKHLIENYWISFWNKTIKNLLTADKFKYLVTIKSTKQNVNIYSLGYDKEYTPTFKNWPINLYIKGQF